MYCDRSKVMASPTRPGENSVGERGESRVILREITATLQNSPPLKTSTKNKSGIDAVKTPAHEIKVKFLREFVEVTEVQPPISQLLPTDSCSLSSVNSTSTSSTKSSSKICIDSPSRSSDKSYANPDIPGLDDLLSACAAIRLEDSFADVTFTSASDEINHDCTLDITTTFEVQDIVESDFNRTRDCPNTTHSEIGIANISESDLKCVQDSLNNRTSPIVNRNTTESDVNCSVDPTFDPPQLGHEELDFVESNVNCLQDSIFVNGEILNTVESNVNPTYNPYCVDSHSEIVTSDLIEENLNNTQDSFEIPTFGSTQNFTVYPTAPFGQSIVLKDSSRTLDFLLGTVAHKISVDCAEKVRSDLTQVQNEAVESRESNHVPPANQSNLTTDTTDPAISREYTTASENFPKTSLEIQNGSLSPEANTTLTLDSHPIGSAGLSSSSLLNIQVETSSIRSEINSGFNKPFPPPDSYNLPGTNTSIQDCGVENIICAVRNNDVSLSVTSISTVSEPACIETQTSLEILSPNFSILNEVSKVATSKVSEEKVVADDIAKGLEVLTSGSKIILDQLSNGKYSESIEAFVSLNLESPEKKIEPTDIEKTDEAPEEDRTSTFSGTAAEQNEIPKLETPIVNDELPEPDSINLPTPDYYQQFLPQRQSTCLINEEIITQTRGQDIHQPRVPSPSDHTFFYAECTTATHVTCDFEKLKLEAQSVVNDIYNTSLDLPDDSEIFTTASVDLFGDPMNVDLSKFETANSNETTNNRLRTESLYVKFDPLVSLNSSMMPQANITSLPKNDEKNSDKDPTLPNLGSPTRNPAIAAIDRLLFYSPCPAGTIRKREEPEKIETTEKTPESESIIDSTMARELELVRSTVLQLEEQLEKEIGERGRAENKLQTEADSFRETINQLQKQLTLEITNKNQINVVVDEYEKSISRLITERERDKKNLDAEKASIIEELQESKNHLAASEVAFNDVHTKYERLKIVVTTSRSNELALKESLAENVEIIKSLENRYEQIKSHAAARLEKANQDLDIIRKQHESESVRLRAMLRKEELKSNSLNELVEQKTKENKELTQILDEVIARVGLKSDE